MAMNYDAVFRAAVGGKLDSDQASNLKSVVAALEYGGAKAGLDVPHRFAQFAPQLMHESGMFRYDREIWGPTPAQLRYEGRATLGNTVKGDGSKFRGYGPIQVTGRYNVTEFYKWCCRLFGKANVPDFVANPKLICTDPWEGLTAIWYWDVGNPIKESLNRYADEGNNEMVTRRVNGGLNGYSDRLKKYDRVALVLLGLEPKNIKGFQSANGLLADGVSGPKTRSAMHAKLKTMAGATVKAPEPAPVAPPLVAAPTPPPPTLIPVVTAPGPITPPPQPITQPRPDPSTPMVSSSGGLWAWLFGRKA